jgi:predicted methyltransferase
VLPSYAPIASAALAFAIAAPLSSTAESQAAADVAARLAGGTRDEADRARDAGRKPAEIVAFLGIAPGMTVVDLIAASGYYTEVLSLAVGPSGVVYAQNSEFSLTFRDGANDRAMTARLAGGRLPNVARLDREIPELGLEPGSIDAAITALNLHDVYNAGGPEAAVGFLEAAYAFLEPGGVLGVIDHVGKPDGPNRDLHRIDPAIARKLARQAGFTIEAESDILRNPDDDHTRKVFAEGLRGHTDRFVLRLRKPRQT